jgi:hypothetical protein
MGTPSDKLAENIIGRLLAEELIGEESAKKLLAPLAAGKARSEDWQVFVELQLQAGGKP